MPQLLLVQVSLAFGLAEYPARLLSGTRRRLQHILVANGTKLDEGAVQAPVVQLHVPHDPRLLNTLLRPDSRDAMGSRKNLQQVTGFRRAVLTGPAT